MKEHCERGEGNETRTLTHIVRTLQSPSDGWIGLSETLNGSVLTEFVDYVNYIRASRPDVTFGDAGCKAIEDTFVSMR